MCFQCVSDTLRFQHVLDINTLKHIGAHCSTITHIGTQCGHIATPPTISSYAPLSAEGNRVAPGPPGDIMVLCIGVNDRFYAQNGLGLGMHFENQAHG